MKKPGYKTSEFWFTFVSFIFSGLYLVGIIGESAYKDDLIRDVSHAVESVILIVGQLVIVFNYIKARDHAKTNETDIKTVELPQTAIAEEKKNERKPRSKKPVNKSRTNSTRSRKTNNSN